MLGREGSCKGKERENAVKEEKRENGNIRKILKRSDEKVRSV